MTNQEKFLQTFGGEVWMKIIVETGVADQFKDYWTSKYDPESGDVESEE